jgi:hydroxymethylglutaryl-CoA synthase
MKRVGIEKINIYGSSLYLDQRELAEARGQDPEKVVSDFLINERSLNPPWEDTVTMGGNAAAPIVGEEEKESIGLFIVGTEGSVDFGKPISTNLHEALGLNPNVRNYETKHACYSGVAGLDAAINWIASGFNDGRKALVVSTDFSRMHLNKKEEFVLGGVAAAFIVSETPKVVEYELTKKGTWTTNIYDTFRPSATHEMGNNEVSLFTYMDALEGAFEHYRSVVGEVDFDQDFAYSVYHTPFPGMAFQAHRTLCNIVRPRKKPEIREDFDRRVLPGIRFSQRLGSSYGASNFAGICSLLSERGPARAGDRISFFSYGSGAIGEFYSGIVLPEGRETVGAMGINEALDERKRVSVDEYESIEKLRESYIENPNFVPDFTCCGDWYDEYYREKGRLYLKEVKDFIRTYEWS